MWVEAPKYRRVQNQDKYKDEGCKIKTNTNMGAIGVPIWKLMDS